MFTNGTSWFETVSTKLIANIDIVNHNNMSRNTVQHVLLEMTK